MIHMRDEELDLIAALATGDLDPASVAEAEALVAEGGEAREEFEAQLQANAALAEAGPAHLTDLERARMRRAVIAEITAPSVDTARPRALRWLRPLAVAAVTVVVVGFGGLMLTSLGQGGDSAAEQAFSVLETDTAGASQTTTTAGADEEAPFAGADAEDATRAVGESNITEDVSAEDIVVPLDLGSVNSREIDEQYLTDIYLGAAQYTADDPGSLSDTALSCSGAAKDLSDEPLLAFGTARYDGQDAQYFGFVSRRLIFVDAEDCSILGEHP